MLDMIVSRIENLSLEQATARCIQVDRARERFTKYFFGPAASWPCQYDLVVNTGRVPLDGVVDLLAALVRNDGCSHGRPIWPCITGPSFLPSAWRRCRKWSA